MVESSSTTVNTGQTEIGGVRTENIPVQVTTIRLTKENDMQWSAAMTMGIAARGRIAYINGRTIEPNEMNVVWDTWFLEDNQVKTWIVNSVSPDIQPLILRKRTARDMWVILEQMYGQKKRIVRVYQLMKDVYSLWQGEHSVADFNAALKSKWEDLHYYSDDTWDCPQDQVPHLTKEWENMVFLFLGGLNEDFEGIRSQILNSNKLPSIEEVYSRVEAEEQRRLIITGKKEDPISYNERSALVSRGPIGAARPPRKCTHCKKTGHTADFCWDLHPEMKNSLGKPSSGKKSTIDVANSSGEKAYISAEQIRDLCAYLSRIDIGQAEAADYVKVNHALAVFGEKGNSCMGEWIVDSGATHHMTGNPKLFHEYKLSSRNEPHKYNWANNRNIIDIERPDIQQQRKKKATTACTKDGAKHHLLKHKELYLQLVERKRFQKEYAERPIDSLALNEPKAATTCALYALTTLNYLPCLQLVIPNAQVNKEQEAPTAIPFSLSARRASTFHLSPLHKTGRAQCESSTTRELTFGLARMALNRAVGLAKGLEDWTLTSQSE
ncbi:hypothetical protein EJ110_NYTH34973 [Nymphaea thermarum]|nr:hypothetical protein EJ110_NYTH34973 [Nymphaea thermarum]